MTDFESYLIGFLSGSLIAAAVAIGLWLLWDADADANSEPTAELERTACEVLAVHPSARGGHIVTFECPKGVIQ